MVDIEEFARLFEPEPKTAVQQVFGVPEQGVRPQTVQWRGKSMVVYDYEYFVLLIKDWMKRYKQTKSEALDNFFGMFNT